MSTTLDFIEYVCEQIPQIGELRYRKMFGEYAFYYKGKVFGGVYDNRFLIKITKSNQKLCENFVQELPYEGAKPMLLISEVDDKVFLKNLVEVTWEELPFPKKRKV